MGAPPYIPQAFADRAQSQNPRVTIFESGHDGYGDAQRANLQYIFPRRNRRPYSYNRTGGNAEARWQGEIGPGVLINRILSDIHTSGAPIFVKEWEDTVPNPLLVFVYPIGATSAPAAAGGKINTFQSGTLGAPAALTTVPTGATSHDDGSGVPYIYVAFGAPAGGTTKLQKRDRAGTLTSVTNLIADKLLSLNNDLYLTATPASGTAVCGVGKVAAGTNPSTAAQPALTVVGFAGTSINNIAASGDGKIPVPLKPEGIFVYDRALDLWVNRAPQMERYPHPDNGKVYWYEDGDLIVGLGQGGALRFNGVDAVPYDPIPLYAQPNNDTTGQLIGAAGNTRHHGVLVTKIGSKRQRTGGVGAGTAQIDVGKTTDGGATYTDYSSAASDGDPTTVIDISALPTFAGNGWLVVGFPVPFLGVYFDMLNTNVVDTASPNIEIWNGAAWVSSLGADMTKYTGVTNAVAWGRSGWVMLGDGEVGVEPVFQLGWVKSTLTVGSPKSRYWARFSFTIGGALTNPTKIKGIELLPYRPPIDLANFGADGADRAGQFPHILFSRMSEDGEHVTHDYGYLTIDGAAATDEIGAVIYGAGGGANRNDARALYFFGLRNHYWMELALDDRPSMTSWPILAAKGLVELPAVDLDTDVVIEDFRVEGVEWNATGHLYYRFIEDGRPWTRAGSFDSLPVTISVGDRRVGRYLQPAIGWTLTAAQQRQVGRPRVVRIDCKPTPVVNRGGQYPVQNPPVV